MGLLDRDYVRDAPRWHAGEPYNVARLLETPVRRRHRRVWALVWLIVLIAVACAVVWATMAGYIVLLPGRAPNGALGGVFLCAHPHCVAVGP